jgi:hypothetical protein
MPNSNQTLIIPCPIFDPICQVILLENSNEWNLSPAKEGSTKKRSKDWKEKKRWNLSWKAPCFEKTKEREDKIYMLLVETLSKERKKGDHNFLECKIRCVVSSIPTHHLHLHYLLFFDFSLPYPHSLHNSPSTMIICHTNSLEFSFAFTIYKV